ncbi:MAG: Ig-like domain-containing protein, partial [Acetobacterium sp.]
MKIIKKIQALLLVFILMFTSFFQIGNVFAQDTQLNQVAANSVGVTYRTHVQNIGWMDWKSNGELSGTEGQSLRMEAMEIKLVNAPENASIEYFVHVQNIGDQKPDRKDGELAGTEGQGLRLEALSIQLKNMPGYSVEYRVHVQNIGWQDWVSDGSIAGTKGQSLRLETVEIRIINTSPIIHPTSVSLNKTTDTLAVGATDTLSATVLPGNATNKDVTWLSDNTAVATVDNTGVVTGVSEGTANIVATTVDGGFTASCAVTVTPPVAVVPVKSISLNQTLVTITKDASRSLIATVLPKNATNKAVTWSSDNTDVATVNDIGKVTGVNAGKAVITATTVDGGFTATCKVTVKNPVPPAPVPSVKSVTVTPATATVDQGATQQLTAKVIVRDGAAKTVTWTSSDSANVDVDANGLVTVAAGAVPADYTITATSNFDTTKKGTATITVPVAVIPVTGVSLNTATASIVVGTTQTLIATVLPADATNKNVTWASDNTAIATVDANGVVTGVAVGSANVTVTTVDGGFTATCAVTVTAAPVPVTG